MLPIVVRHMIYPLHERLLHRPTLRIFKELEDSQWYSPQQLRSVQKEKLTELFRHATRNIPFYRRRFFDAGLLIHGEPDTDRLPNVPLLDKVQIRASLPDMIWKGSPGGLIEAHTGGSSGEPLRFLVDRRRQACDQAARFRTYRWFGIQLGQPEAYLWGSPIETSRGDAFRQWRDALTNHRLLNAFSMSPAQMDHYLDELQRFQPVCLYGYPSSLTLLAEHARRQGCRLRLRRLQAIFVTGEICYPHHREILSDFFNVPVANGYGSREGGFIAHECPQGSMHITAENLLVEVLPHGTHADATPAPTDSDSGSASSQSPPGEIVITHLDAYGMPLIRYRTGDIGRLRPDRCACGRGLPLLDVVAGRTTDFIRLPNGVIKHALAVIYPLRTLPGIRQFRVVQHEDYSMRVHVVPGGTNAPTPRHITARLRPVLGDDIPIEVECVDAITSAASGKFRYVISHVRPLAHTYVSRENDHE